MELEHSMEHNMELEFGMELELFQLHTAPHSIHLQGCHALLYRLPLSHPSPPSGAAPRQLGTSCKA